LIASQTCWSATSTSSTVAPQAATAFIESAHWAGLVTANNLLLEQGSPAELNPQAGAQNAPIDSKPEPPPPMLATPQGRTIVVPEGFAVYGYQLRKDMRVDLALPMDLSQRDVKRLHRWLETLPVDDLDE
jgi:hypothetical protein